jgi:hypothetical protein
VGDKVEGLYRGRGTKWFKGEITARNSDGTYRVLYEDGDKDMSLGREHIRVVGGDATTSKPSSSSGSGGGCSVLSSVADADAMLSVPVGAVVEAQYRGAGPWVRGRVTRDNGDGTYALRFDDKDTWSAAPRSTIRVVDPAPGAAASVLLKDVGGVWDHR